MTTDQEKRRVNQDPLHGITLKEIMIQLFEKYGWEELGLHVKIKCFTDNPSITSSLKFLRKTPWARKEVEALYLDTQWQPKDVWANARNRDKK